MADIRQRYADLDSNTTDVIRHSETGTGTLAGTIVVYSGICNSTGTEVALATSTLQTTANGLLTTIDADTGTIATHAATLAGAVSGTEMQVDVLTLPAITGTVDLGATDNAVLDAIAASLAGTLTVGSHAVTNAGTFAVQAAQSGTWNITNVSGTVSLPTGAATAAKQPALGTAGTASSDVITVQGIASMTALKVDGSAVTQPVSGTFWQATQPVSGTVDLGATDNAVLDAIAASLAGTLTVGSHAVTNAGTFAVQSTLQAGTAYAGKVRLTDGTTDAEVVPLTGYNAQAVAIVDGDGNQLTSFGGGTQYTEDAAAAANPVGNAQILVRADTPAGVASADGDNVAMRGSNYGAAYVTLVDNAGSFVSVGGGTQYDEDTAHVSGDKVTMAGVVRADTAAAQSGTDGDRTVLITDASGRLHVNVGNTVTVGSHAVTNAGTFAVQVDAAIPAGTNNIGDVDVLTVPADPFGTNADASSATGSISAKLKRMAIAMSDWDTGIGAINATLAAGTNGIGKLTSNSGVTIGAVEIAAAQTLATVTTVSTVTTCSTVTTLANGQTAHDSASTGSPLRVGAKAETALSGITLVADGDATDLYAGVDGVLITRPHCNLEDIVQERTTNTDGASTAFGSGLAAPGAGIKLYIKQVTVCNSSATFCTVDLRDGSAGSVLWTIPVPATGGAIQTFDPPLKLSANTALAFDASAATTTLTISANGFKSKV